MINFEIRDQKQLILGYWRTHVIKFISNFFQKVILWNQKQFFQKAHSICKQDTDFVW